MTPPEASVAGETAGAAATPPAVSVCLQRLRRRADFLRAASARRQSTPGFLLQARDRRDDSQAVRVGFTCSKKIGNAVVRNRAKRRLRAVVRLTLAQHARPGWDYVLVGRPNTTVTRNFAAMQADLAAALTRIHDRQ